MRQSIVVSFGTKELTIRPLTFGQVEAMETAVLASRASSGSGARGILLAALSRDHAALDLDDLVTDTKEIAVAVASVLRLGGFLEGEATAAAPNASPGDTSAPA